MCRRTRGLATGPRRETRVDRRADEVPECYSATVRSRRYRARASVPCRSDRMRLRNLERAETSGDRICNFLTRTRALLVPFVILVVVDAFGSCETSPFVGLLLLVTKVPIFTLFAITIHRVILLSEGAVPERGLRRWTAREAYFAIHVVVLTLMATTLFCLPAWTLGPVGMPVGLLLALYTFSRLSLVFPASAIDEGATMRLSWRMTRHHVALVVCIVRLMPALIAVPAALLRTLPGGHFLGSALDTLLTVFVVASLSLAYGEIRKLEYEGLRHL